MDGRYEVIGVPDKNKDKDNLAVLLLRDRQNGRELCLKAISAINPVKVEEFEREVLINTTLPVSYFTVRVVESVKAYPGMP
jgi:hypothetical protein